MGTIRRQSFQATLILGIGALLSLVLRLFIYTKFLREEEIGLLVVLIDSANLFAAFIPLGSQSIFLKYLPFFREERTNKPRGLLFIGITRSLLGLAIFTIFFFVFKDRLVDFYSGKATLFADYFYYLLPLVIVRVVFLVAQSYARALKKNIFPLILKEIIVTALTAAVVICFAVKWFDMDALVFSYVAVYFLSSIIMTYYLLHLGYLDIRPKKAKLRNQRGREILYFGFFAILTSGGNFIIKNIDSILITSLSNLANAGIYNIAFLIGMIIELPRRAVSQITSPFLAEAAANNKHQKINSLYQKSSLNQFIFGSFILICIWTNVDNIFALIPNGEIYATGRYVVLFIGLAKLVDMSAGVNTQIIQNSQYYRFNFYSLGFLAILGVATNVVLIPRLGINGAAIASLISITLINSIRGIYIKWRLDLQPLNWKVALALAIGGLTWAISTFLPQLHHPLADLVYRTTTSLIVFFSLALTLKISDDLNDIFGKLVRKYLRSK